MPNDIISKKLYIGYKRLEWDIQIGNVFVVLDCILKNRERHGS